MVQTHTRFASIEVSCFLLFVINKEKKGKTTTNTGTGQDDTKKSAPP